MGVDVAHVARRRVGVGQRGAHRLRRAAAVLVGLGDVEGVVGGAVARDAREDRRPASLRVLLALEHEHARALAHDEAVALRVEGLGDALARQRAHALEGGDAQPGEGGLGASGDDGVDLAAHDHPGGLADGVPAGGARARDAEARARGRRGASRSCRRPRWASSSARSAGRRHGRRPPATPGTRSAGSRGRRRRCPRARRGARGRRRRAGRPPRPPAPPPPPRAACSDRRGAPPWRTWRPRGRSRRTRRCRRRCPSAWPARPRRRRPAPHRWRRRRRVL